MKRGLTGFPSDWPFTPWLGFGWWLVGRSGSWGLEQFRQQTPLFDKGPGQAGSASRMSVGGLWRGTADLEVHEEQNEPERRHSRPGETGRQNQFLPYQPRDSPRRFGSWLSGRGQGSEHVFPDAVERGIGI